MSIILAVDSSRLVDLGTGFRTENEFIHQVHVHTYTQTQQCSSLLPESCSSGKATGLECKAEQQQEELC